MRAPWLQLEKYADVATCVVHGTNVDVLLLGFSKEFGVHTIVGVLWLVGRALKVSEDLTLVHVEGTSSTSETDTLRSELSAVAGLAP